MRLTNQREGERALEFEPRGVTVTIECDIERFDRLKKNCIRKNLRKIDDTEKREEQSGAQESESGEFA